MSDEPVVVTEDDGVFTVTLNRPQKLNAIDLSTSQALDEATWHFGDSENLRVMIITGTVRYLKNVDAETAVRIGLVHEIYPADEFMDRVTNFARELVAIPADALGVAKLTIDVCTAEDREKTRHIERLGVASLGGNRRRPSSADLPSSKR